MIITLVNGVDVPYCTFFPSFFVIVASVGPFSWGSYFSEKLILVLFHIRSTYEVSNV